MKTNKTFLFTLVCLASALSLTTWACGPDRSRGSKDDNNNGGLFNNGGNNGGTVRDLGRTGSLELIGGALSAASDAGGDNAARNMVERAQLPALGNASLGFDPSQPIVGTESTLTYDIDGDGQDNEVYAFLTFEGVPFIAWEASCHLAWELDGVWHAFGDCEGAEVVICQLGEPASCELCSDEGCLPCEVSGDRIACAEPANNDTNNVTAADCEAVCEKYDTCGFLDDSSTSLSECISICGDGQDLGTEGACILSEDCSTILNGGCVSSNNDNNQTDAGMDTDTDTDTDVDVRPDVDAGELSCDPSCLSQPGAQCCTEASCPAEIACYPVCSSGYQWDVEILCCFDYDTFECDCPSGTEWNPEVYCCMTDGECVSP